MRTSVTTALAGLALAALVLSGCTTTTEPEPTMPPTADTTAPANTPERAPRPGEFWWGQPSIPDPTRHPNCEEVAWSDIWREKEGDPWQIAVFGEPVDSGVIPQASGPAEYDTDGALIAYTAQPGDNLWSITERFCTVVRALVNYNDGLDYGGQIKAGDRLLLRPDPNLPVRDLSAEHADGSTS